MTDLIARPAGHDNGLGRDWANGNRIAADPPQDAEKWTPRVKDYAAPNGTNYRMVHPDPHRTSGQITVHAPLRNGNGYRGVGYLNWTSRPDKGEGVTEIHKVQVHPDHQRQGLASAMLGFARETHADLQHSHALTDDGKAWADKVGALGTQPLWVENDSYERADHRSVEAARGPRGRDQGAPQDPAPQVGDGPDWQDPGRASRPLRYHPQAVKDIAKFDKPIRARIEAKIQQLHHGEPDHTTELVQSLKDEKYHSTRVDGRTRIIHRDEPSDGGLEIGGVFSQHDYETPKRRLGVRFTPDKRVFTHTCGLDHRLFDESGHLRPEVRTYILQSVAAMWILQYRDWANWARIYFAGSEASEWTSDTLEGNNDFDVLIGVDYNKFRAANGAFKDKTNQEITDRMNEQFRSFNGPVMIEVDGVHYGPFDRTTYVNADSYDIRAIKPYAAYDVGKDVWVVKPPHLPHWDFAQMPKAIQTVLRAAESYAKHVLRLPEPERTQEGNRLFQAWHSDRSEAFGPRGEGWWDIANLREKFLDQEGLWAQLVGLAHRAKEGLDLAPQDWSSEHPFGVTVGAVQSRWFHGTNKTFDGDLKTPASGSFGKHWNTDLGVHVTSDPEVARSFAGEHGRVAEVHPEMANPKRYPNETQLSADAVSYAQQAGLHKREDVFGYDRPASRSLHAMDSWLAGHPNRQAITHGFRSHLQAQGHDGIIYGNSYEGQKNHRSAIIFPETPKKHEWRTSSEHPLGSSAITRGEAHEAKLPKTEKCHYCANQATVRALHAEGMAYIPVCDGHKQRAIDEVGEDEFNNFRPINMRRQAMPWHEQNRGESAGAVGAKSVRRAGFKGYVSDDMRDEEAEYGHSDDEDDEPDHEDPHLHHFIREHGAEAPVWKAHGPQPVNVDLTRGVYATQSHVAQKHINRFLANPEDRVRNHSDSGYLGHDNPMFVTHQGRLHATEGHHRVAAALQRGDTSIRGWHYDLDRHPVAENYHTHQPCEDCQYHVEHGEDDDDEGHHMGSRKAAAAHQVWYHGTRPENVAHIREHGLAAPASVNPARWPMLTDSREQAATYARPGGKVLEYHIPRELADYHHPDALLWPADEHDVYGQKAQAVGPKRPIPADYIAAEHDVPNTHTATRADDAYGSGDVDALFKGSPTTSVPFPAAGRSIKREDYDRDLVKRAISEPEHHEMADVDPRTLRATQPSLTRAGVQHYLSSTEYAHHGTTFADMANPGNRRPIIYSREDGQNLILSGHHRAAAALIKGEPLRAVVVSGPFGKERGSR